MRENWTYKKLGEVCEVVMGQSPDGDSINEKEGTEFHQGKTCFGDRFLTHSHLYTSKPAKYAEANSVLLCVRAPVGFPNITQRRICIGRGLCSLSCKKEITNMFLYYSLLGKQAYFEKNSTGSTFKAISSKIVSNTTIPIPSLSEQQSIVAELDKINELISLKKAQLSDLDSLAQSIFYDMFGDPIENEKGWELKKFGDVVVSSQIGLIRSAKQQGQDKAFAYFKMNNITISGDVDLSNLTKVDACKEEQMKYILKQGDFLFNTRNSYELVGKSCVYNLKDDNTTLYNNNLLRIIFDSTISPTYISYLFKDKFIKKQLDSIKKGTTNVWAIYYKDLSKIKILAPPLSLQQEFAKRIELIEQQKAQISSTIKDLETLLASRMQYWFD